MVRRWNFCGYGLITLLIWCFETRARKPSFVIEECTPRFKHWVLQHVFVTLTNGQYSLESRVMSPVDVGIPVSRPRQWCILLNKAKLKPVMPFSGPEVAGVFFRSAILIGDIFFTECGGPIEKQQFKHRLLQQRGLRWKSGKCKMFRQKSSAFLGSGNRVRLARYKKMAQQRGLESGIVDVGQDPGHCQRISSYMPTLLRRSVMVELKSSEVLLPSAGFDVMGLPLHKPAGVKYSCPFTSLLRELTDSDMRHLCGNSMHSSMVGLCILYVLACTTMVES